MDHSKSRARRCAIYTRKSSEEGLEQDFNSLQAQREACEAFIKSQAERGLETHQDRVRRRWNVGRHDGATGAATAARRYRRRSRSMSWWSTRSTGSLARWPTSPRWSRCSMRAGCRSWR